MGFKLENSMTIVQPEKEVISNIQPRSQEKFNTCLMYRGLGMEAMCVARDELSRRRAVLSPRFS